MKLFRISIQGALAVAGLSACIPGAPSQTTDTSGTTTEPAPTASPSSVPTLTPAAGARAAKFIFKSAYPSGSFDAPPAGGTVPTPGSGLKAQRVFNADGSLLAQGGASAPSWPKWITSFEIGVSGTNNTAATSSACARFAAAGESAAACGSADDINCGVSTGVFRISEFDCRRGGASDGNGGPGDGVYVRATFSRDSEVLNPFENVMAVVEYAASGINPAPANPTSCFTGGNFTPGTCSDQLWRVFIKHDPYEVVQPFLMLVPPSVSQVAAGSTGMVVSSKQIFIPLAGDSGLSVFQLSRITSSSSFSTTDTPSTTDFYDMCNGDEPEANSPLCVGMVIYSVTFFRI